MTDACGRVNGWVRGERCRCAAGNRGEQALRVAEIRRCMRGVAREAHTVP